MRIFSEPLPKILVPAFMSLAMEDCDFDKKQ